MRRGAPRFGRRCGCRRGSSWAGAADCYEETTINSARRGSFPRFRRSHFALEYGHAPVAQLDRASGFEPEGREFESLRARLIFQRHADARPPGVYLRVVDFVDGQNLRGPGWLHKREQISFQSASFTLKEPKTGDIVNPWAKSYHRGCHSEVWTT
jgi:hypothetical protein